MAVVGRAKRLMTTLPLYKYFERRLGARRQEERGRSHVHIVFLLSHSRRVHSRRM